MYSHTLFRVFISPNLTLVSPHPAVVPGFYEAESPSFSQPGESRKLWLLKAGLCESRGESRLSKAKKPEAGFQSPDFRLSLAENERLSGFVQSPAFPAFQPDGMHTCNGD